MLRFIEVVLYRLYWSELKNQHILYRLKIQYTARGVYKMGVNEVFVEKLNGKFVWSEFKNSVLWSASERV